MIRTRIITLVFFLTAMHFAGHAQISKKEARKARKEQQLIEHLEKVKSLAQSQQLVLNTNRIQNRRGFSINTSGPNFIKVDGDQIVIQTSSPHRAGYNGLGGITLEGHITNYEVIEEAYGVRVNIQLSSVVLGHSTINLSMNASGNGQAVIRTNYGQRATFIGQVGSLATTPYEAISLF